MNYAIQLRQKCENLLNFLDKHNYSGKIGTNPTKSLHNLKTLNPTIFFQVWSIESRRGSPVGSNPPHKSTHTPFVSQKFSNQESV